MRCNFIENKETSNVIYSYSMFKDISIGPYTRILFGFVHFIVMQQYEMKLNKELSRTNVYVLYIYI